MSRGFMVALGIGMIVAGAFVVLVLYQQKGARLVLAGEITNVRTLGMDEKSSVALVDFKLTNQSQFPFVVGSTAMSMVDGNGETRDGSMVSDGHTKDLFEAFPVLGKKIGGGLATREKMAPGEARAVTLAARFEIPKGDADARKSIKVTVTEIDGTVTELSQ
jgi:hypothetical protein